MKRGRTTRNTQRGKRNELSIFINSQLSITIIIDSTKYLDNTGIYSITNRPHTPNIRKSQTTIIRNPVPTQTS